MNNEKYNSLSVVGTQWGDEGKGKITNYLSLKADMVVRHQGGNNAGHSISIDGKKYSLHLIPSGIFNPSVKNVMANGMVIDPLALVKELEILESQGIKDYQLFISDRAHVLMPYHIRLDGMYEELKGFRKIGTTKKGIGPAYVDKFSRDGIRFADLLDDELFQNLLKDNLLIKNKIFEAFGKEKFCFEEVYEKIISAREKIKKFITDTSLIVHEALENGDKVLFEGAQGVLLCIDHGTYPFVTSSSPTSSSIPVNVGIPLNSISKTLGVVKSYSTRVGKGAFPTEFENKISKKIREIGNEFGTTTGRPRRIGWFDANLVRHAARVSGLTDISVTLLDVLSGIDKLKICKSYLLNGKEIKYLPAGETDFNNLKPIYINLPGWKEDITNVKSFDELPKNAKKYLLKIEELTGVKVSQFSIGPDRNQTIDINQLFK
ncbi:MAG: adenylosuccinate synthetase [Candidatus Tyloplasma litorale]|nr:MAG: adenylosuccinate synthetase [Mycoplasmatales bacterium]